MYDAIVIGAGVNGSSAAYALSKQKKNVLLLEQFPLPHTRGSSHGQTRVFRCLYNKDIYAKMSLDSIPLWREMEEELDETLLIQNGMLEIYNSNDSETIKSRKLTLEKLQVPYHLLCNTEINQRFKPFNFPDTLCGIYEKHGGIVMATKCVAAYQKLFVKNGGVLHDNEQVLKIIPGDDVCLVATNKQTYKSKKVIITAGPYAKKLIDSTGLYLPLKVKRVHLCYWKLSDPTVGTLEAGFPSFMHLPSYSYGIPCMEYPGLIKICCHSGTPVDIDYPDAPPITTSLVNFIQTFMKGVSGKPSIIEGCLYTNTPDENFIIDYHPQFKNIIIGAGFSGTGFKMSPVTGKILADMACDVRPMYDLSTFKIARFGNLVQLKSYL